MSNPNELCADCCVSIEHRHGTAQRCEQCAKEKKRMDKNLREKLKSPPKPGVYVYLDPRKRGPFEYENWEFEFEPFYVGKGNERRSRSHLYMARGHYESNLHKERKIRKIWKEDLEPIIEFFSGCDIVETEIELIRLIGRSPDGPLTNVWPGGESGPVGIKHSAATLAKMSRTRKGRKFSEQHKEAMRAAWTSEKRDRYSKDWIVTDPNGNEKSIRNLNAFCEEQGLSAGGMYAVSGSFVKRHNGWGCRRV